MFLKSIHTQLERDGEKGDSYGGHTPLKRQHPVFQWKYTFIYSRTVDRWARVSTSALWHNELPGWVPAVSLGCGSAQLPAASLPPRSRQRSQWRRGVGCPPPAAPKAWGERRATHREDVDQGLGCGGGYWELLESGAVSQILLTVWCVRMLTRQAAFNRCLESLCNLAAVLPEDKRHFWMISACIPS